MMLRNLRGQAGGAALEDAFEVVDERTGAQLCSGRVEKRLNAQMYPGRGLRVGIRTSGAPNELLMGALLARARQICSESALNARIYASVRPDERQMIHFLSEFGLVNDDARVCMRRELDDPKIIGQLPEGCRMKSDFLDSPEEQAYFLERFNKLYNTDHDLEWLNGFINRDDFMRIQAVAPDSLVSEVLVWRQGEVGVVGYLQTSLRWRRMGVAREMLKYAARYFCECGLADMAAAVHQSVPWLQRTFESAGFYQDEVLQRFPGMNYDPKPLPRPTSAARESKPEALGFGLDRI